MQEVVIASAVRTPIGRFGGSLAEVTAPELGAVAIRAAVQRAGVRSEDVDDVVIGCVGQYGEDAYIARHCAIKAGLPIEVPAYAVNRLCGSGLQALNSAVQAILAGNAGVVVAGGVESMSRFPYLLRKARNGYRMGDGVLQDGLTTALSDPFTACHMGVTAENLVDRYGVTREEQDAFALESQRRALAAIGEGRFSEQIVPVPVPQPKGEPTLFARDEHPRETSLERLAKLGPAFKGNGSVTAGNSSGINDAAAAMVVASASRAREWGVQPRLRVCAQAVAGVPPEIMGIGPVPAVRRVLERSGVRLQDIEVIELNEAFAGQALSVMRELDLDPEKVNPNGGAIALGHPVGATGSILVAKLLAELERRQARYGLVTLCIGGGQGIATLFERV